MIDDDILTIEEVARYLRVSERTVYEWTQRGDLPGGKIGTVWRFKKTEIENWVNSRLSGYKIEPQFGTMRLATLISTERIIFIDHADKRDAIAALADNLANAPQVKNRQELIQELFKREELMSTAIGRGIAIPHVRLASVTDLVVSVGISRCDIPGFQPLDDEPVRLLFMIAAAYNQHASYLQTLAFFSARLKNEGLRSALINSACAQDVYKLLAEAR
jgi:PTS system nitrogen regulatory IIA component